MFNRNGQQDETQIFVAQAAGIFLVTVTIVAIFMFGIGEFKSSSENNPNDFVSNDKEVVTPTEYSRDNAFFQRDRGDAGDTNETKEKTVSVAANPTRVIISSIGVDSEILSPSSPRVDVLDAALKKGAVYYPGSGTVENGNIFLFGHSTNWAVVNNQAYKTFNDLQKLKRGEEIKLQAGGKTYVYAVETVSLVDSSNAFVDLSRSGQRLTISTCDTFGKKADRWVVDAVLKEVLS